MVGSSSLCSSTSTTTLSIACANFGGTWSSASETSSSKRLSDISTGTSAAGLAGRRRRRLARVGARGRGIPDTARSALETARHRREPRTVLQLRRDLAVHQRRTGVPALLLTQVPGEDQVPRDEVGTV